MTDIKDVLLSDILPDIFSDAAKTKAFALAERSVRRKIYSYAEKLMTYRNLSALDDKVLDQLAAELKTQYYSSTMERDVKVRLISSTIRWHVLAGTRTAVEELVGSVFQTDGVREWFEYGGEPFFFKINSERDFSPELLSEFRAMIKKVKNTATSLEEILLKKDIFLPLAVRSGIAVEETVTVLCEKEDANVKI